MYQLNENNSAINGVLKPIYDWESGLLDELAEMYVERLGDIVVAIRLFGSKARGEEKPGSDIDLLLVVVDGIDLQELEDTVTEIDINAGQKLGCPVSTIAVTEKEYGKKMKNKQGFWKRIPQDSRIIFELER